MFLLSLDQFNVSLLNKSIHKKILSFIYTKNENIFASYKSTLQFLVSAA